MGNTSSISETLKFHFGNKIVCTNGQDGTLSHVLFDASARRLTSLAIRQRHFLGKTIYVPFEKVVKANRNGIWLNASLDELAAFPAVEGPGMSLDIHTPVKSSAGNGTLMLVAVQATTGVLAYIVTHNLLHGHNILLREPLIASLTPGQISISADEKLLKSLPLYRSDQELQQEVEQIVFDLSFIHIDLKGMNLYVLDGTLFMDGNISSTLRSELLCDQISGVEGLLNIQNNLVGDDTLAADIALALGKDTRTHGLPIGVYPQLGVVRLSGSVLNAQQKATANGIARQFAGVRSVIDDLLVDPSAAMLYVMSAPEGGETKDITPGKFTRHTK